MVTRAILSSIILKNMRSAIFLKKINIGIPPEKFKLYRWHIDFFIA